MDKNRATATGRRAEGLASAPGDHASEVGGTPRRRVLAVVAMSAVGLVALAGCGSGGPVYDTATGKNLSGPAPRPLSPVPVHVDGGEVVQGI